MKQNHIVFDVHYLAYRAYHSVPGLTHEGVGTSVPFGVLRTVMDVWEQFGFESTVSFCFDVGQPKRAADDRRYKQGRKVDGEALLIKQEINKQIMRMRTELLPDMFMSNLFWAEGFEADDLIASVVLHTPPDDDVVIVSSDHDLYQLLSPRVVVYHPTTKKVFDLKAFECEYLCSPLLWAKVKALAGCLSDNVVGLDGVGEKTAVKFLTKAMNTDTATWHRINSSFGLVKNNLKLTTLPYPGTPVLSPVQHPINRQAVRAVLTELGITSIKV